MHWVFVQEMSTHAQLSLLRFDARLGVLSLFVMRAFSICSFVPFSQGCSNVRKDVHGALPIKSSGLVFLLHLLQSLLVLSRSEVPELSVVTFCCHVNDET